MSCIRRRPLARLALAFVFAQPAARAAAQPPVIASNGARAGATIAGSVHDSIAHAPLAGAVVQLVGADALARDGRGTRSDSLGRFSFDGVPAGRYLLGFFHPMLDSLGLEPIMREVRVGGPTLVRADLAIPSPARVVAGVCGPRSGGVVVGFVRDARSMAPARGATVTTSWMEVALGRRGLRRRVPHVDATTGASGWYALCDVPNPGVVTLLASRDADSTARIDLEVPAEGVLRRDLYLGPADGGRGAGRLAGRVLSALNGEPLRGASVRVTGDAEARVDASGEWSLAGLPLGTQVLEVQAVGYEPVRLPVDIVDGGAPVDVVLTTTAARLDTIKVTAARLRAGELEGFAERRRTGIGHYLDTADVRKRAPLVTTDLFRQVPGVRMRREGFDNLVSMRGLGPDDCFPAVYLNGSYMSGMSAGNLDDWVRPEEIAAMEVYAAGTAPPQYQPPAVGCGSIVVWTKLRSDNPNEHRWFARLIRGAGFAALGLLAGGVLDWF